MPALCCVDCGQEADHHAAGWRVYVGQEPGEDEDPFAVTYCPGCAQREFGGSAGPHDVPGDLL
jgi:hypothetical protein